MNISDMKITEIQFFPTTHRIEFENGDFREINEWSANIVLDDKLIIQISGNDDEAHPLYIPDSSEQFYNDEDFQDLASETLDREEAQKFLDDNEVENNYIWLSENATLTI